MNTHVGKWHLVTGLVMLLASTILRFLAPWDSALTPFGVMIAYLISLSLFSLHANQELPGRSFKPTAWLVSFILLPAVSMPAYFLIHGRKSTVLPPNVELERTS
ncbi:MAG: hypothetical protein AAF662_07845 [Pseudomonadota bacterium]